MPSAIALTLCMLSTNYIDGAVKPFLLAHGLSSRYRVSPLDGRENLLMPLKGPLFSFP